MTPLPETIIALLTLPDTRGATEVADQSLSTQSQI